MRNVLVALLASASVLAPQVALADTWNDYPEESTFEFDRYVGKVYLDSIFIKTGVVEETGKPLTEAYLNIRQTPYCDSDSALSLEFDLKLTDDYGNWVTHNETFYNVPENTYHQAFLAMSGYSLNPTNANISIYADCQPLYTFGDYIEGTTGLETDYEYDPEVLESVETEIENLGDSVTEGVEAVGDVFGDIFGW